MKASEEIMREIRFAHPQQVDRRVERSKTTVRVVGVLGFIAATVLATVFILWAVLAAAQWAILRMPV